MKEVQKSVVYVNYKNSQHYRKVYKIFLIEEVASNIGQPYLHQVQA